MMDSLRCATCTKCRSERLLGTGARSNAYTDFHHTVFHVHSPLHNANTGQPLLPEVCA